MSVFLKRSQAIIPLTEYADDPVAFAREVLGVELWDKNAEILTSLVDTQFVAAYSCASSGASYGSAIGALWWTSCKPDGVVSLNAPTERQERRLLLRYVQKLLRNVRKQGRELGVVETDQHPRLWSETALLVLEDGDTGISLEGLSASSRHLKIIKPAHSKWKIINISAFDTPNVKEGKTVVPGLVGLPWVEHMREQYGEQSDFWRSKVLGLAAPR